MTAETLTGTRAADGFPTYCATGAGTVCAAFGKYAVAANVEDGDIFELCKLPGNCTVIGGYACSGDLDTGAEALDIDFGWAANGVEAASAAGLINSGVLTGDAITDLLPAGSNYRPFPMATGPLYFSAETILQAEANVAAATFAAGAIYLVAFYVMDKTL